MPLPPRRLSPRRRTPLPPILRREPQLVRAYQCPISSFDALANSSRSATYSHHRRLQAAGRLYGLAARRRDRRRDPAANAGFHGWSTGFLHHESHYAVKTPTTSHIPPPTPNHASEASCLLVRATTRTDTDHSSNPPPANFKPTIYDSTSTVGAQKTYPVTSRTCQYILLCLCERKSQEPTLGPKTRCARSHSIIPRLVYPPFCPWQDAAFIGVYTKTLCLLFLSLFYLVFLCRHIQPPPTRDRLMEKPKCSMPIRGGLIYEWKKGLQ